MNEIAKKLDENNFNIIEINKSNKCVIENCNIILQNNDKDIEELLKEKLDDYIENKNHINILNTSIAMLKIELNKIVCFEEDFMKLNTTNTIRPTNDEIDCKIYSMQTHLLFTIKEVFNKLFVELHKNMDISESKAKKRYIESSEIIKKRAKRVCKKLPDDKVLCIFCNKTLKNADNCQKHMTKFHKVDYFDFNFNEID